MRCGVVGPQLDEKDVQVTAREGPLERLGGLLIAALECNQAAFECREICEVARREELALNDGEVDLDLVEPAGMEVCGPERCLAIWLAVGRRLYGRDGTNRCRR